MCIRDRRNIGGQRVVAIPEPATPPARRLDGFPMFDRGISTTAKGPDRLPQDDVLDLNNGRWDTIRGIEKGAQIGLRLFGAGMERGRRSQVGWLERCDRNSARAFQQRVVGSHIEIDLALPGSNTSVPVRSIAKSVRRAVIHCADPPPSGRLPASLISLHGGESISPVAIHDFRMSVATNAADRQYRHALC